uniref:X-linked interleukin-1 receptor accessory protein-like 2 n=1 Tax=Myxine glutinosa TaxID=7769 RepID=UPI00358FCF0E
MRFDIILFYRDYLTQAPPPDGKKFDACIITALDATQAELNFALQELPEALEKRRCYSLWISARNANSCQYMEGLKSALRCSRRLIVVLSPHCVIKSNLSHHEIDTILNTVLDKGSPPSLLIFVCPPPRGMVHSLIKRPVLQRALKELPVLCWEEEKPMHRSSFWSRLYCLLPPRRTSAQKQDWQQFVDEE